MVGGKGKDYFYIEGGGTSLIKDYEKKDMIRVDGYGKGNVKITHKKGNSLIKAGKRTLAKVIDTKLSKNDLQYHGGNTKKKSHDHDHHGHAHHRKADPNEGDVIAEIFAPVADL